MYKSASSTYTADLDQDASDWYNSHPQNPSSPYKVLVTTDPVSYCMDVLIAAENKANKRRKRATSPTEKGFVIGADNACDNGYRKPFCNGPLKPDSAYRFVMPKLYQFSCTVYLSFCFDLIYLKLSFKSEHFCFALG